MAENEPSDKPEKEEGQPPVTEVVPKKFPLKLVIIIATVLLIIGGAAAFLFFTAAGNKLIGREHSDAVAPKDLVFFPFPEIMVDLTSNQKTKHRPFLRLGLKLELASAEDSKTIELIKPRIDDQFQIFLRSLRVEDVQGSAGVQRLREELLKRVNAVAAPVKVKDVLFEVILVQ